MTSQTKTTCTPAELDVWAAHVDTDRIIEGFTGRLLRTVYRDLPPCLGCGGPTGGDAALTVKTAEHKGSAADPDAIYQTGTATFQPCGCVLTIARLPQEPKP